MSKNGMTIGIDLRSLLQSPRTGVGEYIAGFVRALLSYHPEHRYVFFTNRFGGPSFGFSDAPEAVWCATRFPNRFLQISLSLFGRPALDTLIAKRTGPLDVFFSPNLNAVSISPRTRFVLTIHDLSFAFFPDFFSRKHRFWHRLIHPEKQVRRADAILTPSEQTQRDVIDQYAVNRDRVHVAYPGLAFSPSAAASTNLQKKYQLPEKYILFLGTIEHRKNVPGLVEAFLLWKKEHPEAAAPYALILSGMLGYRGKTIAASVHRSPHVRYIGYVEETDKAGLYAGAAAFVYPSFYEGFGFPVLEAMASGVPVVTSNRTSLPEVAGGAAYLVNPHNVSQIAHGLHTVVVDAQVRDQCIRLGRERARDFSWRRATEVFFSVV